MATAASSALDAVFYPRSIAIVGASNVEHKLGYKRLKALKESPYVGNLYAINPSSESVQGVPTFARLVDLPESVDLALIVVPPERVIEAVRDAAHARVKVAQIVTAGFSELGSRGAALELNLLELASSAGLRLIGPNCIGTYSAHAGVTWTRRSSSVAGGISVVSQSGGIAYDLLLRGGSAGVRFNKILSVGNCIDIEIPECVEYLASDSGTETIALYIEGVRDGRALYHNLRKASREKAVFVLKGGTTVRGSESVTSHTGQLAGDYRLWQAMFRQARVREVDSVDGLLSAITSAHFAVKPLADLGIALIGNGGGATVLATDTCERTGLRVAKVSAETVARMRSITGINGVGNPVDLPPGVLFDRKGAVVAELAEALAADANVGAVVVHLNLSPLAEDANVSNILDQVAPAFAHIDIGDSALVFVIRTDQSAILDDLRRGFAAQLARTLNTPVAFSMEEGLDFIRFASEKSADTGQLREDQDGQN